MAHKSRRATSSVLRPANRQESGPNMTINFTTLFTRIGKAVNVADDLVASVDTELLTDVRAFEDELDTEAMTFDRR